MGIKSQCATVIGSLVLEALENPIPLYPTQILLLKTLWTLMEIGICKNYETAHCLLMIILWILELLKDLESSPLKRLK